MAVVCAAVRKVREDYLPRRRVLIHVFTNRKCDPDNMLKVTLDAMKWARLIVDDAPLYLDCPTPVIVPLKRTSDPTTAKPYTRLYFEDLPNV